MVIDIKIKIERYEMEWDEIKIEKGQELSGYKCRKDSTVNAYLLVHALKAGLLLLVHALEPG